MSRSIRGPMAADQYSGLFAVDPSECWRLMDDGGWVAGSLQSFISPLQPVLDDFVEHADRLVRDLPLKQAELLKLSSREFEQLIACVWRELGYEVELTARTRDGGYDVVAVRKAELDTRIIIECKRYNADRRLGVGLVRNLYGVKQHERATKAILATTATFSKDATEWAALHKWELELRDYLGVLDWLRQARRSKVVM